MNQLKIMNLLVLSIILCFTLLSISSFATGRRLMPPKVSPEGREMIKSFEGIKLKAYKNPNDTWTIGYGHTKNVKEGDVITKSQAEEFLVEDLKTAESDVARLVKVALTQNQFDALASLMYNIGGGREWKDYQLLKKLNNGDYDGAAKEFITFRRVKGKINDGLVERRKKERELFEDKTLRPWDIQNMPLRFCDNLLDC